jgi:hypothetical protein
MQSFLKDISQAQSERLAYIEFRAYFLGEVKRADIIARFGIATAAATRDIALYRQIASENLILDSKSKTYLPRQGFIPIFEHSVDRVLTALTKGFGEGLGGQTKALIASEIPQSLHHPEVVLFAPITQAINRRKAVKITYNSFSTGETEREIVPFALANNGLRWHVRAYDRLRKGFRDFVLTRVGSSMLLDESRVEDHEEPANDFEWGRIVELELVPHPKKKKQVRVIAMDYGMSTKNPALKVRVRAALAGYFLRQWSVDCSRTHKLDSPEVRLWLRNALTLYGINSASLAPGYESPPG